MEVRWIELLSVCSGDAPVVLSELEGDGTGFTGVKHRNSSCGQAFFQSGTGASARGEQIVSDDNEFWLDNIEEEVGQCLGMRRQAGNDDVGGKVGIVRDKGILSGSSQIGKEKDSRSSDVPGQDERRI